MQWSTSSCKLWPFDACTCMLRATRSGGKTLASTSSYINVKIVHMRRTRTRAQALSLILLLTWCLMASRSQKAPPIHTNSDRIQEKTADLPLPRNVCLHAIRRAGGPKENRITHYRKTKWNLPLENAPDRRILWMNESHDTDTLHWHSNTNARSSNLIIDDYITRLTVHFMMNLRCLLLMQA